MEIKHSLKTFYFQRKEEQAEPTDPFRSIPKDNNTKDLALTSNLNEESPLKLAEMKTIHYLDLNPSLKFSSLNKKNVVEEEEEEDDDI